MKLNSLQVFLPSLNAENAKNPFYIYLHDLFAWIDQHPSAAFFSAVFITAAFSPDLDLFNSRTVYKVHLLFRQLFSVSRRSGLQAIVKSRISQALPAEVPHLPFLYSLYLFDLNLFLQKIFSVLF